MNFKKILLGSAILVSSMSLIACGGDSSSSPPPSPTPGSSASGDPYVPPEDTQYDIISMSEFSAKTVGEEIYAVGSFSLIYTDTTATSVPDSIQFKSLTFQVINDGTNTVTAVPVVTVGMPQFPTQRVLNMAEIVVSVALDNEAFAGQCGAFHMDITATATDGKKDFPKTAKISFTRPDVYCKAPESSSSAAPVAAGVEMVTFDVQVSTASNKAIDLTAGVATASATADIIFTSKDGTIKVTSGNGSTFAPISNGDFPPYDDDWGSGWLPEDHLGRPTTMNDFKYVAITGTSIDDYDQSCDNIYVVKTPAFNEATGAGFFAFVALSNMPANNGESDLTIRVWKAK